MSDRIQQQSIPFLKIHSFNCGSSSHSHKILYPDSSSTRKQRGRTKKFFSQIGNSTQYKQLLPLVQIRMPSTFQFSFYCKKRSHGLKYTKQRLYIIFKSTTHILNSYSHSHDKQNVSLMSDIND